MINIERASCG